MSSLYRKFVRLLNVELESLRDELQVLVEHQDKRLADKEITDYVRNYNVAVLRNELMGLHEFLRCEGCLDADSDGNIDEITDEVCGYIKHYFEYRDNVPAIYELVKLRIDKIKSYLEDPVATG
jgi:hypothetical protein